MLAENTRSRRRGTEALELALMLPILLGLTFGIVEVGWYFYVAHSLEAASREGARAAVPYGTGTNAQVTAAVNRVLGPMDLPNAHFTVTTIPADVSKAAAGTPITVQVSAPWNDVGLTILGMIKPNAVTGETIMMKE